MSNAYYERVGNYMLRSWAKNWSPFFHLTVYTEDVIPFEHERIHYETLDQFADLNVFLNEKHSNSRCGMFGKKSWPIMNNLIPNSGKLVWVDADVITEGRITPFWIDHLIGDKFSAHLGVPQNEFYSVETGFFIINRSHPSKELFRTKYTNIYMERDFSKMYKPFDGDSFGRCVTECTAEDPKFSYNELSPRPDKVLSPFNKRFKGTLWHLKAKHKEKDLANSPRMKSILPL